MPDEVHEAYIKQLLEAHRVPQVTIAWQGGEPTLNYLCAGYKAFFTHADKTMRIMADLLRRDRPASEVMAILKQAGSAAL